MGHISSKMLYFTEKKHWEIVDMANNTLAFTNGSTEFPLGARSWYFLDSNCTDSDQTYRTLNLHQALPQPGQLQGQQRLSLTLPSQVTSVVKMGSASSQTMSVITSFTARTSQTRPTVAWSSSRSLTTNFSRQRSWKTTALSRLNLSQVNRL